MVRASAKAPMSGLSSWYRMSRLQKARTAKAGRSIRATRPAITRAQRVNIAPWRASVLREPVELVAEARQKRPDREYSGVRLSAISLTQRATRIRSRRAIREERVSQNKNDVAGSDTWPVRTGTNPGYVGATSPDFSLLKYRPPILRHFRCGARGARCPYARTHPWCRTMESRRTG